MSKILPIGSVIKVENAKLMVVGHFSKEKDNKNKYYYMAVPYPIGYLSVDKTVYVACDCDDYEVLHEGYQSEKGKQYTEQLSKLSELTPNEVAFYSRLAVEAMSKLKGGK